MYRILFGVLVLLCACNTAEKTAAPAPQKTAAVIQSEILVVYDVMPAAGEDKTLPLKHGDAIMTFFVRNTGVEKVVIDRLELIEDFRGEGDQSVSVSWSGVTHGSKRVLSYWDDPNWTDPLLTTGNGMPFNGRHYIHPLLNKPIDFPAGAELRFEVTLRFPNLGIHDNAPNWHRAALRAIDWHTVDGQKYRREYKPLFQAGKISAE